MAVITSMRIGMLAFMVGCIYLAHVEPLPRGDRERALGTVVVESYCGYNGVRHRGTGVVISERHMLTVAHVVACPSIPTVHILTITGARHRVVVTREDITADVARLEVAHAGRLGLGLAPPGLAYPLYIEKLCAYTPWGVMCGELRGYRVVGIALPHGTSGSGVYDETGYLVGLVSRDVYGYDVWLQHVHIGVQLAVIDPTWLEGT